MSLVGHCFSPKGMAGDGPFVAGLALDRAFLISVSVPAAATTTGCLDPFPKRARGRGHGYRHGLGLHLATLSCGVLVDDLADGGRALALDLLPKVDVVGPVDAAESRNTELEYKHGRDDAPRCRPPVQLLPECLEEGIVHRVCRIVRRVQRRD